MEIVNLLSNKSGLTEEELLKVIINGSNKYKVYSIPKRSHGKRIIAHPSKKLKNIQKYLLKVINFPNHTSAMAYEKGTSIKKNAIVHSKNQFLLKMDLAEFFNSITPEIFWGAFSKHFKVEPTEIDTYLINNILFWHRDNQELVLSVGAPTSPKISNFCMLEFDKIVFDFCQKSYITYTRYADDMTFSTNIREILFDIPNFIESLLFYLFGSAISINYSKTVFSSKAHNRHVTGVTITNEGNLSLGRKRKRYIKHLIYQFTQSKIDKATTFHLKGLIAFASDIEPSFVISLKSKYGEVVLNEIMDKK